jgi:hypothetical protein
MMSDQDLPRTLSPTQFRAYARCPLAYRYRFRERRRSLPTPPSLLGHALHTMMEANFRAKRRSHADLSEQELEAVFDDVWDQELPPDGEGARATPEEFAAARELGYKVLAFFRDTVAPEIKPHLVEHRFRFAMEGVPAPIVGQVDLVDMSGTVIDHKTAGGRYGEDYLDHDVQLFCYSLGYTLVREGMRLREGQMPAARRLSPARVDVIIRGETPELQRLEKVYDEDDVERIGGTMRRLAAGIFAGEYEPFWVDDEREEGWRICESCDFEKICDRSLLKQEN